MTKPKTKTKLADCGRELGAVLDRIDREHQALVELVKERKGRIAALEKRAHHLRDLLAGRDFEQGEIPGTEASVTDEACGNCGKPADQPSPDCIECDHGRSTGVACKGCGKPAKQPEGALTTEGYCWPCNLVAHPEDAEPKKPSKKKKRKGVGKCAGCGGPAQVWVLGEKRCFKCSDLARATWRREHPDQTTPAEEALP